ncbi:probable inactive leucine-rich repeat receptor kinase At3g03770 [Olea europaea subsp. europaea]|uniref:Probable inactive leucine-rich repeat receptor kinase At3g03770 n=1 Tax=Olea europaea subsp. europaea TaxID=158383 RepID=A0A8S0TA17_OLEEU|nr:probable inactive leucine-rich repeat receptor kinase At3g03770 [Olea europaea subsp. europaea]
MKVRVHNRATKLGALGLPAYRTFSLEVLEEATNNFDTLTFIGEGTYDQMYRGQLKDGSFITIICLKMKRKHGI